MSDKTEIMYEITRIVSSKNPEDYHDTLEKLQDRLESQGWQVELISEEEPEEDLVFEDEDDDYSMSWDD